MRFSLILASRGRPALLEKLIESVARTTIDPDNIEMLVGIDDDDDETAKKCAECRGRHPWLTPHVRGRGTNMARDYHNWLLPVATGEYLFVLNDDVEVATYAWDAIAALKFTMAEEKNNNLTYGQTSPAPGDGYSEFPMVTAEAAKALGFLMPEEYPCWGADSFLWAIYNHHGLTVNMRDIVLTHARVHDGTRGELAARFHDRVQHGRNPALHAHKLISRERPALKLL